jgi:hypothetical protein
VLKELARKLDAWIADQNLLAAEEGLLRIKACTIRVVGQTALMEAKLPLHLLVTRDVDVKADYEDAVRRRFAELLADEGLELDPLGHEIWMPAETRYDPLFDGKWVRLLVAEAEAVLLSKALKAPTKNRSLIGDYLALGPSKRFLVLATKYQLDLEQFA